MSLVSLRFFTLFIMSLIALLGSKKYGLTSKNRILKILIYKFLF